MSVLRRCVLGLPMVLSLALVLPAQAQEKVIKIASQTPLSGGQAALGEGIKLGAQLGIENFKGNLEKKGYKIEFVPFDDQAKPDVGVANAKNIIADPQILGVIGHLNSGVAIPASKVYNQANVVQISPASTAASRARLKSCGSTFTQRVRSESQSARIFQPFWLPVASAWCRTRHWAIR